SRAIAQDAAQRGGADNEVETPELMRIVHRKIEPLSSHARVAAKCKAQALGGDSVRVGRRESDPSLSRTGGKLARQRTRSGTDLQNTERPVRGPLGHELVDEGRKPFNQPARRRRRA